MEKLLFLVLTLCLLATTASADVVFVPTPEPSTVLLAVVLGVVVLLTGLLIRRLRRK